MKVGVTALITPSQWTFAELIQQIKAAGYEALEVVPRQDTELTLDTPDDDLRKLAAVARDAGIDIVSLCGSAGKPTDLLTDDPAARREGIENTKAMLRTARAMGADTILHTLGRIPPELYYDTAYANALDSLKELAPFAQQAGVSIAVEYVWNGFLMSPLETARFLDEVGSPSVGFYFDPGNMRIFQHSEHWVRICARHIKKVHVKDFRFRDGQIQWPPLMQGDVNFAAVMHELRAAGYDGALTSEVDLHAASLEQTARAIRTLIAMD